MFSSSFIMSEQEHQQWTPYKQAGNRAAAMSASQERRELESELENRKRELREDAAQISGKIEDTKAKLSPMNVVREKPLPALGAEAPTPRGIPRAGWWSISKRVYAALNTKHLSILAGGV